MREDQAVGTKLEDETRKAMTNWRVPGLALTLVQDDEVLLARGFGRRSVLALARVDRGTLFQLASCGKAFTAAAVGMLVDQGKLNWDDAVVDHLPDFRLSDPYLTAHVKIRDLLTHRTGLPSGDLLWISGQHDRKETLRRLRNLKPIHGLRERFEYQNLMYVVAGELIGAVSGEGYDSFVRGRMLRPLGMRSSLTNTSTLSRYRNVAEPHAEIRGHVRRIRRWEDPIGSGDGSILSTARDMVRWLRFQLGEGAIGSTRLVRRATFQEMHTPQIVIRAARPELDFLRAMGVRRPRLTYGLGWMLLDYRGVMISRHAGGIDGMSCVVTLVPEEKLGVAVLANLDSSVLPDAIAYGAIDACLGFDGKDWSSTFFAIVARHRAKEEARRRRREATRVRKSRPSLPLRAYVGRYEDAYYGVIQVQRRGVRLLLRFGKTLGGPLSHWHYDTFQLREMRNLTLGSAFVTFTKDSQGHVEALLFELGGGQPLRFDRVQ